MARLLFPLCTMRCKALPFHLQFNATQWTIYNQGKSLQNSTDCQYAHINVIDTLEMTCTTGVRTWVTQAECLPTRPSGLSPLLWKTPNHILCIFPMMHMQTLFSSFQTRSQFSNLDWEGCGALHSIYQLH